MPNNAVYKKELVLVLSGIEDPALMRVFLEDLLSPAEFTEIAKRLELVRQLDAGISQREIAESLGVGIATVTRGSRALKRRNSGFQKILDLFFRKKR